ncbi:putative secreted signaling factor WNT7 [Daphnia pulex]|uniref:Protein Wnt n=1 Tax=Daphnia pulex TaxID=6669 RepID=E9HP52_DAPPU|nr:putative secreted signaling factor WNT7 [Daphnia pulex]|eukprot:EFX66449.1 putative secreted signaling factor WNT7 [Daphnia pulex]
MALSADLICGKIPGLTYKQRLLCAAKPDAMVAISNGAKLGLAECQEQFKYHRWNCTAIGSRNGFGHVVVVGSREAAYLYAVWSSGLTYAIAQACSQGAISSCGGPVAAGGNGWKWGGCSADVRSGASLAKRFADSRETEGDDRSLMNLHNNKAGRKIVKSMLKKECKCHGVSGSCSLKTCWEKLPAFRDIGDALMKQYREAKAVVAKESRSGNDSKPRKLLTLQLRRKPHNKPRLSELVFLNSSPNYCEANPSTGSLGVVGRRCNRTSTGADGCNLLCCGRGYNTHQFNHVSHQCNCKFHWCCEVKCQTCTIKSEEYTCK